MEPSPAELAHLALREYGLSPQARVELLALSENATFRVDDPASGAAMILRVHRRGYHSLAEIASELQWLTALRRDTGICTPAVIPSVSGERIVTVSEQRLPTALEQRHCVMFQLLPGREPAAENLVSEFERLGALTARLHQHARSWSRPSNFARFHWDLDAAFGPSPRWGRWQDGPGVGPGEQALLSRAQEAVTSRLISYGRSDDRYGLIHADLRLANLLVEPGAGIAVIDFDDCGFGWYLYDLAAALSFLPDNAQALELCDAWLGGYRSEAALSAADEAEVATFLMFRRLLLLAWVGSHPDAGAAIEHGSGFAAGACELAETYLREAA